MRRQLSLRAPANGPRELINRSGRVKRHEQFKVIPRLSNDPARLMNHMKPLDDLARHRGHEQRRDSPPALVPGGTGPAPRINPGGIIRSPGH